METHGTQGEDKQTKKQHNTQTNTKNVNKT